MNVAFFHARFACSLGLLLVACGGGASSGGGQSPTGPEGPCSVAAGTYTQHFTVEPGGTQETCPPIADQTLILNADESFSGNGGGDAGGQGCSVNANSATCTITTKCTNASGAMSSELSSTFTFAAGSVSGKETIRLSDASGKVLSSCTYDVTMTRT